MARSYFPVAIVFLLLCFTGCKKRENNGNGNQLPDKDPQPPDTAGQHGLLLSTKKYYGSSMSENAGGGFQFKKTVDSVIVKKYTGDSIVLVCSDFYDASLRVTWSLSNGDTSSTRSPSSRIQKMSESTDSIHLLGFCNCGSALGYQVMFTFDGKQ